MRSRVVNPLRLVPSGSTEPAKATTAVSTLPTSGYARSLAMGWFSRFRFFPDMPSTTALHSAYPSSAWYSSSSSNSCAIILFFCGICWRCLCCRVLCCAGWWVPLLLCCAGWWGFKRWTAGDEPRQTSTTTTRLHAAITSQKHRHLAQIPQKNMTRLIGRTAFHAMLMAVQSGKRRRIAATRIQKIARGFLVRNKRITAHSPNRKRLRDDDENTPPQKKHSPHGAATLAAYAELPEPSSHCPPPVPLVRQTACDREAIEALDLLIQVHEEL